MYAIAKRDSPLLDWAAMTRRLVCSLFFIAIAGLVARPAAQRRHQNEIIDLWMAGKTAFGVFVPNEAPRPATGEPRQEGGPRPKPVYTTAGGQKLAANALYDFVFLNLETAYDGGAVKAIADGLRSPGATGRKALIVRVPAFHEDPQAGRARIREVFAAGGDGITFPHVETLTEAQQILDAVRAEKVDVWSTATPSGEKLVMMMIEDPQALAEATAFANLKGYSILACGIGSLTQALAGNREAAEAGAQTILGETKRAKLVNMLTASTQDVEKRVKEGFLAILAQGQDPDAAISLGRKAAGR
jgi:2-keto-3-deoxy-L-rhamnonate aldolase RhmA